MHRANLSNDYFTNRQDRYFVIEDCRELCDFYNKLVEKVTEFSFLLEQDGNTSLSPTANCHPYKGSWKIFSQEAASRIQTLFQEEIAKSADFDKAGTNKTLHIFHLISSQITSKNILPSFMCYANTNFFYYIKVKSY